jgi:hypothetical protein
MFGIEQKRECGIRINPIKLLPETTCSGAHGNVRLIKRQGKDSGKPRGLILWSLKPRFMQLLREVRIPSLQQPWIVWHGEW